MGAAFPCKEEVNTPSLMLFLKTLTVPQGSVKSNTQTQLICAYAVSRKTTASIKPKVYNTHEGKLYLNYNKGVQRRWLKDLDKGIQKADKNWPKILGKKP